MQHMTTERATARSIVTSAIPARLASFTPDQERAWFTQRGYREVVAPMREREIIDQLQACQTPSQYRAWLNATQAERSRATQSQIERIEAERLKRESYFADLESRTRVREIVERVKATPRPRSTSGQRDGKLLAEVLAAIDRHGLAETRFGREAINDPRCVEDLRNGRQFKGRLSDRIRVFIASLDRETV